MRLLRFKLAKKSLLFAGVFVALSFFTSSGAYPLHIAVDPTGSYRWRNDDGTERTATFSAPEGTPLANLEKNTPVRLRIAATNPGNDSGLLEKASTALGISENSLTSAVIDTVNGYAYFGTNTSPGTVIKVRLGTDDDQPVEVGTAILNSGENQLHAAVIDTVNGYAYFGTYSSPGVVVKIRLGTGDAPPVEVGAATLNDLSYITAAVIDPDRGYAYFGGGSLYVDKIVLGTDAAPPVEVGSKLLYTNMDSSITSAVIDPAHSYAYFATDDYAIVKIALGQGGALPAVIGILNIVADQPSNLTAAAIDAAHGYAYFGTYSSPGTVIKVALGEGDALPTTVDTITLDDGDNDLVSAAIDTVNGYAYFGANTVPGAVAVIKVALGALDDPPAKVDSVSLNGGEDNLMSSVIDPVNGYAYFGTNSSPGDVIKISIAPKAQFRLEYGAKETNCSSISSWTQVPATATSEAFQMYDSANLTDGAPTTRVSGLTDANASFKPGQVKDASSQTSQISLGENEFTELEYSIEPTANAAAGAAYCFRLTDAGTVTVLANAVPEAMIANGAYRWRNDDGTEAAATFSAAENAPLAGLKTNTAARLRFAVGNTDSDSALLEKAAGALGLDEGSDRSAVIDASHGYAYFGTFTAPGQIIKVALGAGAAPPHRVGALTLHAGEDYLTSAVIDPGNGYAYFGTSTAPGQIIKVALGAGAAPPERVGAVTLNSGEQYLFSAVIDPGNGHAYFAGGASPGIIVKVALGSGDAPPVEVGAVTLNSGEYELYNAVIDPAHGYAYFGTTDTSPGIVIKVALGNGDAPPRRVGAVTLNVGENQITSAVIDAGNGYAYFSTDTNPGIIVKVALGGGDAPPTRIGALTLNDDGFFDSAVIDVTNGFAYFGTFFGSVIKIALGAGDAPPTLVGAVALNEGQRGYHFSYIFVIDPANGYAYFGTADSPNILVKISLGAGAAPPSRVGKAVTIFGVGAVSAAIDAAHGYAYFGTDTSPGQIVKVALGAGDAPPVRVGAVTLNSGEDDLTSAAIDASGGYAYFGTNTSPGIVVKVALGSGAAPPVEVGAVTLDAGEDYITSAAIDAAHGYAYFGTDTSPGIVVKIGLNGAAPPIRAGSLPLTGVGGYLHSAVIDTVNNYAYFGTGDSPGVVVKVALGAGAASPTLVGDIPLQTGEDDLTSAVIDAVNGYAYFGTFTIPGIVVKIGLNGNAAPVRIAALTFYSNEGWLSSAVIDTAHGYAYFGSGDHNGAIVQVALGAFAAPPTRVRSIYLYLYNANFDFLFSAVIDPANNYIYFGADDSPANVIKVSLFPEASFRLEYGNKQTTCDAISLWTQVPATATSEAFQMHDSANLTDGEPTTDIAGLTAPDISFKPGEVKDTSSQTAPIALNVGQFTEVEYSIVATENATAGAAYCFRMTDAGNVSSFTRDVYAEADIFQIYRTGSPPPVVSPPVITPPAINENVPANVNANLPVNGPGNNLPANFPVVAGTTFATYRFINPGNATSFNLYEAPPASSLRLLASNNDPNATTVTEGGLTPNTPYSDRVITAVGNGIESEPSAPFQTFVTLLNNFDSVVLSYDPVAKTAAVTGAGNLPNLTVGYSGMDFVVKDASGKALIDSGFLQTNTTGVLSAVDLNPGETYTVTVTPRNSAGVLSPAKDFSAVIPAAPGVAKITLVKTAVKIDYPTASAAGANTAPNTKQIEYAVTAANVGTGIAKSFVMTDPLPAGLDLTAGSIKVASDHDDPDDVVSASYDSAKRTVKATLNELEPNESFTITFIVTPSRAAASGKVKNKASASWEE